MKIITYKECIQNINKKVAEINQTKWEIFDSTIEKYIELKKPKTFESDDKYFNFYNSLEQFKRFLMNKFESTFDRKIDEERIKKEILFESSLKYKVGTYIVLTSAVKKHPIGTLARIEKVQISKGRSNRIKGYTSKIVVRTKCGNKCDITADFFDVINNEVSEIPKNYILIS
jgi:hypothetical protein